MVRVALVGFSLTTLAAASGAQAAAGRPVEPEPAPIGRLAVIIGASAHPAIRPSVRKQAAALPGWDATGEWKGGVSDREDNVVLPSIVLRVPAKKFILEVAIEQATVPYEDSLAAPRYYGYKMTSISSFRVAPTVRQAHVMLMKPLSTSLVGVGVTVISTAWGISDTTYRIWNYGPTAYDTVRTAPVPASLTYAPTVMAAFQIPVGRHFFFDFQGRLLTATRVSTPDSSPLKLTIDHGGWAVSTGLGYAFLR